MGSEVLPGDPLGPTPRPGRAFVRGARLVEALVEFERRLKDVALQGTAARMGEVSLPDFDPARESAGRVDLYAATDIELIYLAGRSWMPEDRYASGYQSRALTDSVVHQHPPRQGGQEGRLAKSDVPTSFKVLPRRWVVERTFSWLGQKTLQLDGDDLPAFGKGRHYLSHDLDGHVGAVEQVQRFPVPWTS